MTFLWDYNIDEPTFRKILRGETTMGHFDTVWAARRVIEYAPYKEIVELIGYKTIVRDWPSLREGIKSQTRKRGMDFLVEWLKTHRPDLV